MVKSTKKTPQPLRGPHKKQKSSGKREENSRVQSALQARVVKRTQQRDEANLKLSRTRSTIDTLFQANPIPTALTRLDDDSFINVNVAFLKYFDLRLEDVIGQTAQALKLGMEPGAHERISLIEQLKREGGVHNYEREMLLPSGKHVTILASLQYLCIDDTEAILSAFVDITEQKLAEQLLRNMVDAAPDATVVIREDGTIVLVNKQLENVFGHARQDLIGKPLSELIPEPFRELHPQHRLDYFSGAEVRPMGSGSKLYARRWDGAEFPVEISLSPLKTAEGTLAIAAIRDITKRIEAERRIRRLATLLSEAEQKERLRISQVLHDDLQQRLFAVKLQLTTVEDAYSHRNVEMLRKTLAEMNENLAESIAITRNLNAEFSPGTLQGGDLADAFAVLSTQMQKQYGLNVALKTNNIETNVDSRLGGLLFQMVRELLFNVFKHAGTLQADLILERVGDEICITVSDEGKGFDPVTVLSPTEIAHGLLNIRQRLELLGCRMEITSKPGVGTRIAMYCPDSN